MEKNYKQNIDMYAVDTDADHILHRIGSDDYTEIRHIMAKDPDAWEEVSINDLPLYTKEEYKEEVIRLIREKYDGDDENAIFRKMLQSKPLERYINEYESYNSFVEECKLKAKENLWQRNSN